MVGNILGLMNVTMSVVSQSSGFANFMKPGSLLERQMLGLSCFPTVEFAPFSEEEAGVFYNCHKGNTFISNISTNQLQSFAVESQCK